MARTALPRIDLNAPFILGYTAAALLAMLLTNLTAGKALSVFACPGTFQFTHPLFYLQLFTHVLGHVSWPHLISNFFIILLLGPLLEEKYGAGQLALMTAATALLTGVVHILLFEEALVGASGVAFMMIILSSLTNVRRGTLPLTFLVVSALFLGQEIVGAFREDQISQLAHILGGLAGGGFGLWLAHRPGS